MTYKERFLVSRTYSETTPDSVDEGDFSDGGFVFENRPMSLDDVLRQLRDCSHLSVGPAVAKNISGHTWAETGWGIEDYETGCERSEAVHIKALDGSTLEARQMVRIYRLAKLCK